jgi:hypothetical protein
MILFYCLLMALAVCYWATIYDVRHRRLHTYAFIVLLVATGWERWQSEHDAAKQIMIADVPQTDLEIIQANYTTLFERGKEQWLAKQKQQHETQLSMLSMTK